jgi:hypothetical protein
MSRSTDSRSPETPRDARELGNWARVYAQNRSLGMVVFMVIFVALCVTLGGSSYLAAMAYRLDQWLLFGVSMVLMVAAIAATVYLSVPRWGGKLQQRVIERLYAKEGIVRLAPPPASSRRSRKWIGGLLGATFGACILASVVLFGLYRIPQQYMQPFSAIYCVPFLVGLWLLQRPVSSPIMLLWPALYALHAILIVAGVPIVFTGPWDALNMLIPVAGYGMLVGLISHVYSRFALRRLRGAAEGCVDDSTEEPRP